MAVPGSGNAITLGKIYQEIDGAGYSANPDSGEEASLTDMSTGNAPDSINSASSSKPDGSTPHSMSEFYSYDHSATSDAFPGTGEDSWFQLQSPLSGDAPPGSGAGAWGQASVTHSTNAQAGANLGFQNDTGNERIAMRWTTFTSAAASSYSYAYVGYDGFSGNTFYAKCSYAAISSGFAGSVENPASYSPASGTYAAVSTSTYSPIWQWSITVNSGFGTRSLSSMASGGTNPDWTVASNSSGANAISGPARVISLSATRGSGGGGGFGGDICVHEDMLISTQKGNMTIDEIIDNAPPKIYSYNKDTLKIEAVDVENISVVEHDNLYKINDIMLTEDHIMYAEDYTPVSVNPELAKKNYGKDSRKIQLNDRLMKYDGGVEKVTSIERYEGVHRTYTIKTKLNNFYADGVLVDSEI